MAIRPGSGDAGSGRYVSPLSRLVAAIACRNMLQQQLACNTPNCCGRLHPCGPNWAATSKVVLVIRTHLRRQQVGAAAAQVAAQHLLLVDGLPAGGAAVWLLVVQHLRHGRTAAQACISARVGCWCFNLQGSLASRCHPVCVCMILGPLNCTASHDQDDYTWIANTTGRAQRATRHRARRARAFCSPRSGFVLGGSGSNNAHSGGMPPSGIAYAC